MLTKMVKLGVHAGQTNDRQTDGRTG